MLPTYRFKTGKFANLIISDPKITLSYLIWVETTWPMLTDHQKQFNAEISRRKSNRTSQGRVIKRASNA